MTIALVGDRDDEVLAHRAIPQSLEIANRSQDKSVDHTWIHTAELKTPAADVLAPYSGIWCVPASPYENMDGALSAIRYARETGRPFLGTCGGFQHALIEYFRNVLGCDGADNLESNRAAEMPVVAPLQCSLVERTGNIHFTKGSRIEAIYGTQTCHEGYHCSYGFNDAYSGLVADGPLRFSGFDEEGDPRAFELTGHAFYIGTLFQPERSALSGTGHPLISAFVAATAGFKAPSP